MKQLQQSAKEYYQKHSLPQPLLKSLLDVQQQAKRHSLTTRFTTRLVSVWREAHVLNYAAAFVVSLTLGVILAFIWQDSDDVNDLTQRIVMEVAMNHNKAEQAEYHGSDYTQLSADMPRLNFVLKKPDALASGYRLHGARYCSIQGQLAAQLQLKYQSGGELQRATLYVTSRSDRFQDVSAAQHQYGDTQIRIWHAQGLFYVLAKTTSVTSQSLHPQ